MNRITTVVESAWFNSVTTAIIVANAALIGVETYVRDPGVLGVIRGVESAFLICFIAEWIVRFLGRRSMGAFWRDGWNIFDLVIIVSAFLPEIGPLTPILRILRVLRVLRLVRAVPELRLIIHVLGRSVVSMKYIGLLAGLMFYIFAVTGYKLFGQYQPEYATLHESLFTLFRIITGDDWTALRYEGLEKVATTRWLVTSFYVVWIAIGTFVLINLIVGAIVNNYQEVQQIEKHKAEAAQATDERIEELAAELNRLLQARKAMGRRGGGESGVTG